MWEIRTNLSNNKIARVLFCSHGDKLILLHDFIKKMQKTPKSELNIAMIERLFEEDDCRRISLDLIAKIERVLVRLDEASGPEDMHLPGFGLHLLKGDLAGY